MKTSLYCLLLMLILISCNKDDNKVELTNTSTSYSIDIELRSFNKPYFILIENQNGERLYGTTAVEINTSLEFDIELDDRIDVTYGYESNLSFGINSLLDVQNGSLITSRSQSPQIEPCFIIGPLQIRPVKLTITDIGEIDEIYNPIFNKGNSIYESTNLTLTGSIYEEIENQLTIKEKESEKYKSYLFDFNGWELGVGDTLERTISYNEFCQPQIYEIDLDMNGKWGISTEVCTDDNKVVQLLKWSTYSDYIDDEKFKLFILDEVEINKINILIFGSSVYDNYTHLDIYEDVPTAITFIDPQFEFITSTKTEIEFSTSKDYDLNRCTYSFLSGNRISNWQIYNVPESLTQFKLPTLPELFLEQSEIVKEIIDNPVRVINSALKYKSSEANLTNYPIDIYNSSSKLPFDLRGKLIVEF